MRTEANVSGNEALKSTEGVPVTVSAREMQALNALAGICEEHYLNFKAIARRSKLDPAHVRRSVRALARKGLAEYAKGLWTDEGDLAGSGYRATAAGRAAAIKPIEEDYY